MPVIRPTEGISRLSGNFSAILIPINDIRRPSAQDQAVPATEALMPNPFMQTPVLIFIAMVVSFLLVLGPVAAADLVRSNRKSQ